jgi:hypothetical protein
MKRETRLKQLWSCQNPLTFLGFSIYIETYPDLYVLRRRAGLPETCHAKEKGGVPDSYPTQVKEIMVSNRMSKMAEPLVHHRLASGSALLLLFCPIICMAVLLLNNCGPFYTTLATYYFTDKDKDFAVTYYGYKISLYIVAVERDNRQGTDDFAFIIEAKSIEKYADSVDTDTLKAIRMEPICVRLFKTDSTFCLRPRKNAQYEIYHLYDGFIYQEPRWGGNYETPIPAIPKVHDSIEVSFTVTVYNDRFYNEVIDQKDFSEVLYRKYRKSLPLSR